MEKITAEKLNRIAGLKNKGEIIKALTAAGFADMGKHSALKKANLTAVFCSDDSTETGWIEGGKFSYKLAYFKNVSEIKGYDFVFVQINKDKKGFKSLLPYFWGIYYRETNNK